VRKSPDPLEFLHAGIHLFPCISQSYTNPHEFGNSLKNVKFHIFVLRIYTQFCVFTRAEISQAAWISACNFPFLYCGFTLFFVYFPMRKLAHTFEFPHAEIHRSRWISTLQSCTGILLICHMFKKTKKQKTKLVKSDPHSHGWSG